MRPRRVFAWNIRQGGGKRSAAVIDRMLDSSADLLVISEFRSGASDLSRSLAMAGYQLSHPDVAPDCNTVLVASRDPFIAAGALRSDLPDVRHLWGVETEWISLIAIYLPLNNHKRPYWEALVTAIRDSSRPCLLVGDFNTGSNTLDREEGGDRFHCAEFFDQLPKLGFVDAWRSRHGTEREYSWVSPKPHQHGFRIDHAFASKDLAAASVSCRYDHSVREQGISDHSALILEIDRGYSRSRVAPTELVWEAADSRGLGAQSQNFGTRRRAFSLSGRIYAFQDPGLPGLVKLGKDAKWPNRLRMAQSHTPRGMLELACWEVNCELAQTETRARSLFQREAACPGREWVRANPEYVKAEVSKLLGAPVAVTELTTLKPYDEWRDWPQPLDSRKRRWFSIAVERRTHRIKVVHSIRDVRILGSMAQTYSAHGIDWLESWCWPEGDWEPSRNLHPLDRRLVELWSHIVTQLGFGTNDLRVGWLRDETPLEQIRSLVQEAGLVRQK